MECDWFLLLLVLLTTVAVKLLRPRIAAACTTLVRAVQPVPQHLMGLRSEVQQLKKQLSAINMMDRFAEHARLQRTVLDKENALAGFERSYSSKARRMTLVLQTLANVALQVIRVGVIVLNRSRPVAVLPQEQSWPLSPVLSFPTGLPGAVGTPLWGLMCIQAVDAAGYLATAKWTST